MGIKNAGDGLSPASIMDGCLHPGMIVETE